MHAIGLRIRELNEIACASFFHWDIMIVTRCCCIIPNQERMIPIDIRYFSHVRFSVTLERLWHGIRNGCCP